MSLRDDLHQVADGAPLRPVAMDAVRAKARTIRRRRAAAAVGGSLVGVAAIAAGVALVLPGGADHSAPGPATQTPLPTRSAVVTTAPLPTTVSVNLTSPPVERTTGASVSVPNWLNGQLLDAQGDLLTIATPVHHPVHDSATGVWSGFTLDHGQWTWMEWSAAGAVVGSWPAPSDRVGITPDGTTWAVMLAAGGSAEIRVFHARPQSPTLIRLNLPSGEPQNGAGVDGILPNGDIVFEGQPGDVRIAHADGSVTALPGGYATVAAITQDGSLIAQAQHSTLAGTNCYDFVTEDGHKSGESCFASTQGISLSASGQVLFTAAANPDGTVIASVAPSPLGTQTLPGPGAELRFPKGAVLDTADGAWEGNGGFVVPVWFQGSWQLVWLSKDGYQITRSLITRGSSTASPYLLGAGPLTSPNP